MNNDSVKVLNWNDIRKRARGAYLGLAIGDALGATVEFMLPREIKQIYGVHDQIIGGGWLRLRPGQITDDTQMSIALGQSIIQENGFDVYAAADAFVQWLRTKPIDVGSTCRRGIQRYIVNRTIAGPFNEHDAGNGACMRNLPIALASLFDVDATAAWSVAQCHITHNNPLSDAATISFARMVQSMILGGTIKDCSALAKKLADEYPYFRFDPYRGHASGYIVDTAQTVLYHFFKHDTFESIVTAVVNCGEDADTTGALAGMLAGARFGADAIPSRWLRRLDKNIYQTILDQTEALLTIAKQNAKHSE